MGSVLVVSEAEDVGIRLAAAAAARRLSPGRLRWVSGADLAAAAWVHTVDGSGAARTRVIRGEEELVNSEQGTPDAVWFRATTAAPVRRWADPRDAAYGTAEFAALLVSWLHQPDSGAVNRVDGASPWGPSWAPVRWRSLAAEAGLPVSPSPERAAEAAEVRRAALVVGDRVVSARTPAEAAGCRRLAAAAGCAVLDVAFDAGGRVVTARPFVAVDSPEKVAATAEFLVRAAS
jgi:hypothetical protein